MPSGDPFSGDLGEEGGGGGVPRGSGSHWVPDGFGAVPRPGASPSPPRREPNGRAASVFAPVSELGAFGKRARPAGHLRCPGSLAAVLDLNLCNFAPQPVRGSHSEECRSALSPASPGDSGVGDFRVVAPGAAGGVWRKGGTASGFADPCA